MRIAGPKQHKFYKNLMQNRLKWEEEIIGEKKAAVDKEQPGERNKCDMVSNQFNGFTITAIFIRYDCQKAMKWVERRVAEAE